MVRRRVLFRRSGVKRGVSLLSFQSKTTHEEPKTTHEALRLIASRQIPVRGSLALQSEYDRINKEFFKGRLPEATILLAELSQVKHRAFTMTVRGTNIIVINTAKSKTLEEQKGDLRHEIVHVAGVRGHGTMFELYAEMLNAPLGVYGDKPLYKEEYEKYLREKERRKEEEALKKREQLFGAKKGEGTLMMGGKVAARVVSWTSPRTGYEVVPKGCITDYKQVPKTTPEVTLVLFDKLGYPKMDMVTIPRNKLEEYHLVP